ncbi:MAG: NAD-dependent epimerase/dehydratase family protein [Bacilli bacterium]|nr:NAD-dependent epimerase/dehydratase family protein [Bacilli bacterium]MBN2876163.1 NAD-dependent epimerase/dehydratase family protein [Bacilli bacterium]
MKVLFIGGTGIISTAVSKITMERGIDLYILNRGHRNDKVPEDAKVLVGDIYNPDQVREVLKGHFFDAIVQWISFTVEHVTRDYNLFKDFTKQYVFISSASAYHKPLPFLPVTEEVPLGNKYWQYSENKKKCEEYLLSFRDPKFHVTIIRPSHTYNEEMLIAQLNSPEKPYTLIDRMQKNKPIILPDDGQSLWTLTFNQDFASAFVDVLGNPKTYDNFYHLTGEKVYTWEQLNKAICDAVGVKPNVVFIPTDTILEYFPEFKGELYGDKKDNTIFDNSKIKEVAPHWVSQTEYSDIVKLAVKRFLENPELQIVDEEFNKRYDALIEKYQKQTN